MKNKKTNKNKRLYQKRPILGRKTIIVLLFLFILWLCAAIFLTNKNIQKANNTKTPEGDYSFRYNYYGPYSQNQSPQADNSKTQYNTIVYVKNNDTYDEIKKLKDIEAYPVIDASGNIYYINRKYGDDKSSNKIIKYNIDSGVEFDFYTIDKGFINSVSFKEPNLLYFSTSNERGSYGKDPHTLYEYNLSTNEIRKIIEKVPTLYGGLNFLGKSNNDDVIGTFGGDGCGGYGSIAIIKNGQENKILETGGGCIIKPLLIRYFENKKSLLLADVVENKNYSDGDFSFYTKIYYLNIENGEKEDVYNFQPEDKNIKFITFDEKTKAIWVIKNDGLISINPDTKVATSINYPKEINASKSYTKLDAGVFYAYPRNDEDTDYTYEAYSLDLTSGKLDKLIHSPNTSFPRLRYVGSFNSKEYYSKITN